MAIEVTYPETDFVSVPGGNEISLPLLEAEVEGDPGISTALSGRKIYRETQTVPSIVFKFQGSGSLPGGEQTALDALVAAHVGALVGAPGIEHGLTPRVFSRVAAPTANDDETMTTVVVGGYRVADIWIETGTGRLHFCLDASTGAANWERFD